MQRDGFHTSLWQDKVKDYQPVNECNKTQYDVIIVGAGITGVTTALQLQKKGKQCLLIDAHTLCFGTTGGTTAHINTMADSSYSAIEHNFGEQGAKQTAELIKKAIALIKHNIQYYNIDCAFEDRTSYVYAQTEKEAAQLNEMFAAGIKAGIDASMCNILPVPTPFETVMCVRGDASFNPVDYVFALAKAYEEAGGVILLDCKMTDAHEEGRVFVETTKGDFECSQLIYATHIPPGVNLLHLRCAPYRSYAIALTLIDGKYPAELLYDMQEPYHYMRTQEVNGKKYLVIGGEDHKTGHNDNTEASFLRLESFAKKIFNVQHVAYKWSSQYYESNDGLPYIGHMPGQPGNIFVATGYGGNGMVYGTAAAQVLSDMILGVENEGIKLFDPNRIKPIAGFTSFIKENVDVVKQLLGKWFSSDGLEQIVALAPGDAMVVNYEGQRMALYKETNGTLHAIDPVCTHMKCKVTWNNAEKTWDCPCHGARYSYDGKVLTGPASKDLEKINLVKMEEVPNS